jgi:acetoin utilization protein AcuB
MTSVTGFSDEVLERMSAYGWPGNVRELENVVERAVVLARSDRRRRRGRTARLAGVLLGPAGMRNSTVVARYMTPSPHTIGKDQPLAVARHLMRHEHIRHLPVLDAGKLVGVVSDRELGFMEALPGAETFSVEDAAVPSTYAVAPEAPLDVVAAEMAELKVGSAVVMDGGRVVGMFTAVDALRALADVLAMPAAEGTVMP